MAKTLVISINLGKKLIGLSLSAEIIDSVGDVIESNITTGFVEIGGGYYLWEYGNFPDSFRGGVKFFDLDKPSEVLVFTDISTEELTCDFTELERKILAAIVAATGKTIEELSKEHAELAKSIEKTFELLQSCCSPSSKGTPIIQSPKIGIRGSRGPEPDMRFG